MSCKSTLALLGGQPVRSEPFLPYNTISEEEKHAVMEVLDSGELSGFVAGSTEHFWGGAQVRALENEFCKYFEVKHAIAVNSATSGLHCAVSAMNVGPGDEIITTPYTMSASATSILMTGAVPVFADIDPDIFCLDPTSVEANITEHTKGILAVNLFGHPADLDALRAIADQHGIFLIEDNAQAPDAIYKDRKTGTIGDAGIFSFNRHKTMQSGEGGVVITNSDDIALKAALMRNHGEVAVAGLGVDDIVNTMGVNYRMTELEAAIARCQFRKLPQLNAARIHLAGHLTKLLSDIPGLVAPAVKSGCSHVYYFYVMKYIEEEAGIPRELFAKAIQAEGFSLRTGYVKPLYLEPLFQQKICFGAHGYPFTANPRNASLSYAPGICPVTECLQDKEILLTHIIYPPLTTRDMDDFATACHKVFANKDDLLGMAHNMGAPHLLRR